MTASFDLSGRLALVTGAGQGNGLAIARGLAGAGARVVLTDINAETVAAAAADIGPPAEGRVLDVRDAAACDALAADLAKAHGGLDILVNNAGVIAWGRLSNPAMRAQWRQIMDVNLDGVFNVTHAHLEALKAKRGCIVNIASMQSFVSAANSVAYTASKGGIAQFTKGLADELSYFGIRVNAIAPGVIETPMIEHVRSSEKHVAPLLARIPLGRLARPEELAGPAVFLCSEAASYVTGVILPVDGGYTAR